MSESPRVQAVNTHYTPEQLKDLELFRTLLDRAEFTSAKQLCRERLLAAREPSAVLWWTKDSAIVSMEAGDAEGALDLLASVRYLAESVELTRQGKYFNSLGLALHMGGRLHESEPYLKLAVRLHKQSGNILLSASSLHNLGRLRIQQGGVDEAFRHLEAAANVARVHNDSQLLGEIEESKGWAFRVLSEQAMRRSAELLGKGVR